MRMSSLIIWQEVTPTSSLQIAFKIYLHCPLETRISIELCSVLLQRLKRKLVLNRGFNVINIFVKH